MWCWTAGVRRILLATSGAHEVYRGFELRALVAPQRWREIDLRFE
jgi:hypothetical protein